MRAVFRKEFRSYFTSPIGYVVLAFIYFFGSFSFFAYNMTYGYISLQYVFQSLYSILLLLVLPILTMRLFSDEKRQKTDQVLFTAPTSLTSIVLGKFFAALLLYVIGIGITLVYAVIIAFKASPDWLVVGGNFLGLLLLGGMIIAIGLLVSCLTESQFIAVIGTFGISLALLLIDSLSTFFQSVDWIAPIVSFLSVSQRYAGFTTGLVRYNDVIFFLSMTAMFLFLAVRVLDRKRWN